MLPPNVGGSAYSTYCLRDPVASSTGVPNRVRESTPPVIRSSPVTVGPAFSRSTAIANHEPARTWPWIRARAFILRPSAADADGDRDEQHGGEHRDGGEQAGDAARGEAARTGQAGSWTGGGGRVGASTCRRPEKLQRSHPVVRPSPPPLVAVRPRPIVRCIGPGPDCVVRAPRADDQPESAPRGIRARDPPVPRAPIRSRGRRRPRAARRAAVRRHRRGPRSATLLARSPHNAVRLDLPARRSRARIPTSATGGSRGRFAAWRSDGTLRKDPRPGVYVYEQTYRVPGTDIERTQRGFFARLRLEPFGPDGGVLPHERTLAAPREDRYRLLRATGVNTSPVVVLYARPVAGRGRGDLADGRGDRRPLADVTDDDGVRHRLWRLVDRRRRRRRRDRADRRSRGAGPVYIADGHHRYETALRYRDERRMTRSCEPDPPFDFLLVLFLDADDAADGAADPPRRARPRRGRAGAAPRRARRPVRGDARRRPRTLVDRFDAAGGLAGGEGRFGLVTRDGAWLLTARRHAFERLLPAGGDAVRRLDVTLLGATLEALAGIDAAAVAGGERIRYTKSAAEARLAGRGGHRRRRRRVPARADARRLDPRRLRRGRRHAPEVDLLLSQGPHRARVQPARVVGPTAGPMTDPTSSDRLLARTAPSNGRPVRKDEIELVDRGLYIESWLPERRSRRKPILFVHGELGGSWVWERYLHHFAGRGWEGHALNLRNHFWSATADPDDARRRDLHRGRHRGDGAARARRSSWSATGSAACWRSRRSSACPRPRTC